MKFRALLLTTLIATAALAADPTVKLGSKVRVQASDIGAGWHTGTLKKGGECTMVFLDKPTKDGYTSLALNAVKSLEVANGTAWSAVDVKSMLAKETQDCREAAND